MKKLSTNYIEEIKIAVGDDESHEEIYRKYNAEGYSLTKYEYLKNSIGEYIAYFSFQKVLPVPCFSCPDCGYKVQPEEFFEKQVKDMEDEDYEY